MEKGLVIKTTGSRHIVLAEDKTLIPCRIKGSLRTRGIRSTNPVAVGDRVEFFRLKNEGTGVISDIIDRKNYIIRRSSKLSKETHILAANLDQAFLMVSLVSPRTTLRFIDRFLSTSEAYRIPSILLFNKTDLYGPELLDEMGLLMKMYKSAGYESYETSAIEKKGIEELREKMQNKISLVAGNSGVGKSSIINAVDPALNLKTATLSQSHNTGRHTTTFSEMFELASGGYIIDTPGIKGFGIVDMEREEIFHFFPEIFKISKNCQYYNCMHTTEPKCAVREAVENNEISFSRYESYLSLYYDDKGKYRVSKY